MKIYLEYLRYLPVHHIGYYSQTKHKWGRPHQYIFGWEDGSVSEFHRFDPCSGPNCAKGAIPGDVPELFKDKGLGPCFCPLSPRFKDIQDKFKITPLIGIYQSYCRCCKPMSKAQLDDHLLKSNDFLHRISLKWLKFTYHCRLLLHEADDDSTSFVWKDLFNKNIQEMTKEDDSEDMTGRSNDTEDMTASIQDSEDTSTAIDCSRDNMSHSSDSTQSSSRKRNCSEDTEIRYRKKTKCSYVYIGKKNQSSPFFR